MCPGFLLMLRVRLGPVLLRLIVGSWFLAPLLRMLAPPRRPSSSVIPNLVSITGILILLTSSLSLNLGISNSSLRTSNAKTH
jgi:hypothetical protein